MLVVSDASPINILIRLELVHILAALYNRVLIPTVVASELTHSRSPELVREFITKPPEWLEIRSPQIQQNIPRLDPGETAAITLAQEITADFLLVDDKR